MEAGGSPHRLYHEDLSRNPEADLEVRPINDSLWVVADAEELRGGAWLRDQYFSVGGEEHRVGWMKYAIAESQVDPKFAMVPMAMVRGLVKQQPRLMALGMGGHDSPFAKLLDAMKWRSDSVPFYFLVLRPYRVLRGLEHLRRRPAMALAMDAGAWTGLGWLGNTLYRAPATLSRPGAGLDRLVESEFGPWAVRVWAACREAYHALAVRDARSLNLRFPASGSEAVEVDRVRVQRAGADVGWACVQVTDDLTEYFGSLRVGLLLDALAPPDRTEAVLAAAVGHLRDRGADIVVANFSHEAWGRAARRLRFLSGPTNVVFYRAAAADELLSGDGDVLTRTHITRTDD